MIVTGVSPGSTGPACRRARARRRLRDRHVFRLLSAGAGPSGAGAARRGRLAREVSSARRARSSAVRRVRRRCRTTCSTAGGELPAVRRVIATRTRCAHPRARSRCRETGNRKHHLAPQHLAVQRACLVDRTVQDLRDASLDHFGVAVECGAEHGQVVGAQRHASPGCAPRKRDTICA